MPSGNEGMGYHTCVASGKYTCTCMVYNVPVHVQCTVHCVCTGVHCKLSLHELKTCSLSGGMFTLEALIAMYTETSCLGILMLDNCIELLVHDISS